MSDLTERLRKASFQEWQEYPSAHIQGAQWPVISNIGQEAADEIDRLTAALAEARKARKIEIDDGVLIYREGGLSITVCAETATVYDIDSAMPAVKVPLEYAAVHEAIDARALKEKS